jgi:hypothetical protein
MNNVRFWTGTLVLSGACGLVILATAPGYQISGSGRVKGRVTHNGQPLAGGMVIFVPADRERFDDTFAFTDENGDYTANPDWRREGPGQTVFRICVIPDAREFLKLAPERPRGHEGTGGEPRPRRDGQSSDLKLVSNSSGPGSSGSSSRVAIPASMPQRKFSNPLTTDLSVRLGPEPARIDIDVKD